MSPAPLGGPIVHFPFIIGYSPRAKLIIIETIAIGSIHHACHWLKEHEEIEILKWDHIKMAINV